MRGSAHSRGAAPGARLPEPRPPSCPTPLAFAQREDKRLAPVAGRVEFGAVRQGAGVVDWGGGKEQGGGET